MKLTSTPYPYSSIAGGGLVLLDATGAARFQISLKGTTAGISKEQNDAISKRLHELINTYGLELP